jgi:hypothetical protein
LALLTFLPSWRLALDDQLDRAFDYVADFLACVSVLWHQRARVHGSSLLGGPA